MPKRVARHEGAGVAPAQVPTWKFFAVGDRRHFKDELDALGERPAASLVALMTRHAHGTTRAGKHFKVLGDGLMELRHKEGTNEFRVLFARQGNVFIALTAFYKNQQKTPRTHLDRGRSRLAIWKDSHPRV